MHVEQASVSRSLLLPVADEPKGPQAVLRDHQYRVLLSNMFSLKIKSVLFVTQSLIKMFGNIEHK